ncbi:UNVERIFIED_CONTAM: hypothetical protein Sradi_6821100 [Sesamum radiatum]|uniref:Reverse transcriptase zinc-binding domain-containing protein n=1 Tax=Sesamum radiatum TaxID=300843 RepID=A0AAW2JTB0_SESRA
MIGFEISSFQWMWRLSLKFLSDALVNLILQYGTTQANGRFSVRSAYRLAWSMRQVGASPSAPRSWSFLWAAKVPPKVRLFAWKACHNSLPLPKLAAEDGSLLGGCPMCDEGCEDVIHVLFLCHFARQCWALSHIRWEVISNRGVSVEDWFRQSSEVSSRWSLPRQGWVKINFDAATFANGSESGWGVVARSDSGQCLAWASCRLARSASPEVAEAVAAREAACLAFRFGWRYVIIEGDCEPLVLKLQSSSFDFSCTSPIVHDIKSLISNLSCCFSLVRRTGNRVAHSIARAARAFTVGSWNPPRVAVDTLISDLENL